MAEHLSLLQLDEEAAGLPLAAEARAHLGQCARCAGELAKLQRSRAAVSASPEAARRLEALGRVGADAPAPRRISSRLRLVAAAIPLAAAIALFVVWPDGEERLKGTASVEVLSRGRPVQSARAGERVEVAVGGAGYRQAAVLAVDAEGRVSRVWPASGTRTGRIAAGAQVRLEPGFEVTAGSLTLHAFFSERPLDLDLLARGLEERVAERKDRGEAPLEVETPSDLSAATARQRLGVPP